MLLTTGHANQPAAADVHSQVHSRRVPVAERTLHGLVAGEQVEEQP
jgi:hypothetical protein